MEDWYTTSEIYHWLKKKNYSDEIARELSTLFSVNFEEARKKGFSQAINQCKNIARKYCDLDTLEAIKKIL